MPPAVSVLLPARNALATIDAAIESVCTQTFRDFELLVVDDGSSDGTSERLVWWAHHDQRVQVIRTEGIGLVGALNLGLQHARGELLARMDADDESLPTRFEKSVAALNTAPQLAGLGTGVEIFRDDQPVSPNLKLYGAWLSSLTTPSRLFHDRFVESPLCHPSVMLRTSVLRQVGGWRDGDFPEDWELWLRLLAGGHQLSVVPEVLFRWRDHDRRATRTDPRYRRERHMALRAQYVAPLVGAKRCVVWGAGDTGIALLKHLAKNAVTVDAFIDLNPRKIGQRIHGARVIFPDDLKHDGQTSVLSAVSAKGARAEIRAWLESRGWVEGIDFTCAA